MIYLGGKVLCLVRKGSEWDRVRGAMLGITKESGSFVDQLPIPTGLPQKSMTL
ncbi:MAG: hypothetical protein SVZ03_13115 [Spirochaetota bacterium]|nr:hypothetical protein [Spirochaetota bacterium]